MRIAYRVFWNKNKKIREERILDLRYTIWDLRFGIYERLTADC